MSEIFLKVWTDAIRPAPAPVGARAAVVDFPAPAGRRRPADLVPLRLPLAGWRFPALAGACRHRDGFPLAGWRLRHVPALLAPPGVNYDSPGLAGQAFPLLRHQVHTTGSPVFRVSVFGDCPECLDEALARPMAPPAFRRNRHLFQRHVARPVTGQPAGESSRGRRLRLAAGRFATGEALPSRYQEMNMVQPSAPGRIHILPPPFQSRAARNRTPLVVL